MAEVVNINGASRLLGQLGRVAPMAASRALSRAGLLVVREAKANAPRSPTNAILSSTLKRKKRTARKTHPGGLEKSIDYKVSATGTTPSCSVFVASNAFAGKYARRIHDEKGRTWQKRGPGTIAKGARADDKFVERAINDNQDRMLKILQDEVRKALS